MAELEAMTMGQVIVAQEEPPIPPPRGGLLWIEVLLLTDKYWEDQNAWKGISENQLRVIANAFRSLEKYRIDNGLPPGKGVVARLDIAGETFFGVSGEFDITLATNPIAAKHAEANAFQKAFDAGITADTATLYSDKELCDLCARSDGVPKLASQLGIKELSLFNPGGPSKIP
jgi:hypothetical protein